MRHCTLARIGDEIPNKRGRKFLTVVVDHDTGRLVGAAPGNDKATLARFLDALGEERCAAITRVSADDADRIDSVVNDRRPTAVCCADPFHVTKWATAAPTRSAEPPGHARALKQAHYALWTNPEDLTGRPVEPHLLKEGLRLFFQPPAAEATDALNAWIR